MTEPTPKMSKGYKKLNRAMKAVLDDEVDKLLTYLSKRKEISTANMSINLLFGAMFTICHESLDPDKYEAFIETLVMQFRENFKRLKNQECDE